MNTSNRRKFIKNASLTGILAPFAGQVFSLDKTDELNVNHTNPPGEKNNYLESIKQELVKQLQSKCLLQKWEYRFIQ
jgi:hypothetical protein